MERLRDSYLFTLGIVAYFSICSKSLLPLLLTAVWAKVPLGDQCLAVHHIASKDKMALTVLSLMEGAANVIVQAASCFDFVAYAFHKSNYKMPEHILALGL